MGAHGATYGAHGAAWARTPANGHVHRSGLQSETPSLKWSEQEAGRLTPTPRGVQMYFIILGYFLFHS